MDKGCCDILLTHKNTFLYEKVTNLPIVTATQMLEATFHLENKMYLANKKYDKAIKNAYRLSQQIIAVLKIPYHGNLLRAKLYAISLA